MAEKIMNHIHLKDADINFNPELNVFEMVRKIHAEAIDMADEAIVQACIRTAQSVGLTDLILIDRQFVLDALREKIEREKAKEAENHNEY